jgi:hypothetical protein
MNRDRRLERPGLTWLAATIAAAMVLYDLALLATIH